MCNEIMKIFEKGMTASERAALILAASRNSYRKTMENSEIFIHEPLDGASGQARDVLEGISAEKVRNIMETIVEDTDCDYITCADEAKQCCLNDTAFPSPSGRRGEEYV